MIRTAVTALGLTAALALGACEAEVSRNGVSANATDNTLHNAGEDIENAFQDAGNTAARLGDVVQNGAADLANGVRDTSRDVANGVDNSVTTRDETTNRTER